MKAFIIHLPDRQHSVDQATVMYNTLKSYEGIEPELFQGIPGDRAVEMQTDDGRVLYPYSIKSSPITDEDLKKYIIPELWDEFSENHFVKIFRRVPVGDGANKMSTPGVLGCFYSHYALWEKCAELDEPIMIFEDDVKFFRGFVPIDWRGILILSLGKTAYLNEPYDKFLNAPAGNPQPYHWGAQSMPGTSGYAIKPKAARSLVKFYKTYFTPADNAINQTLCPIECHNYLMGRHLTDEEGNVSMIKTKIWNKK